ncbi:MAG: TraG family conjugative transposon ATPase, partial [Bacteroidetes bacterium]|nr:TraG family conjugative transposon ATPase [Bacteroidota bacterium]
FHRLMTNVVKILGDGYLLQKLDILSKARYPQKTSDEYLQRKYFEHFAGREYTQVETYLILTLQVKKGAFYVYDAKALRNFKQVIGKVLDILKAGKTEPVVLREKAINLLVMQILGMQFSGPVALNNYKPDDHGIEMGDRSMRSINLVNIDDIDLPPQVSTFIEMNDKEALRGFPVDFLSFLFNVPDFEVIVYNQVIEIPPQIATLRKLEAKKKKHSGIPDPANTLCVEDIDLLLNDVARESQLLVNCHFNILVVAKTEVLQKACNHIESALFQLGVIASKSAYNQMELFRCSLPGNGVELKAYDWFQTTCDAALCFYLKEAMPADEPSDFLIRFTDRQGVPVGFDPSDLPMRTNRINNRNKFVLGPSGSGKSFFMNALIQQYMGYNMDMVIVDTGHSYSGLCSYYGGQYITYSEEHPITMNPFQITDAEYNIEKKDFLGTLIGLLWKGAEGSFSPVERDVIANVISAYYLVSFAEKRELKFDTFYEFALEKIPEIKTNEKIPFDLDEFRYVLKKFYTGGEFGLILNQAADESLFGERFIVFEIDNIKESKILFPIVTVIIMDVFIQKMRLRKSQRKALVLEEAWKALASPIMANFLLYLNKTVRKFWGEIIEVTQELGDIIGNPIVKDSIISNSDTIILLDQSKFKDNYNEIAALLSINETERKKIFSINQLENKDGRARFKEVYIRRGAVGEVYGVEMAMEQYLTFTTEKPEKSAVEIYTDHYGSYPLGLDAIIADMKNLHLSLPQFINQVNAAGKPLCI